MTPRDVVLWLAEKHLGLPYRWAGDDPMQGFDCSGLMVELLQSVGALPRTGDWSASALAVAFPGRTQWHPPGTPPAGALVFWAASGQIIHVELVWRILDNGVPLTIGASGGGSATVDAAAAARQNAYVKVRPLRPGWVLAVDPF
jgi:hypothetical protein